jgi:ABC-type transport system involved in multi-copper enzyme maturation permease subunit
MSNDETLLSVAKSEWIKFRTVRSTLMGVIVFSILTIGLGILITSTIRAHWGTMNFGRKLTFDPVSTSLAGVLFAQFAVGVIGSLFITSEYSSGAIRTTLTAVPHRIELALAKLLVLIISMLAVCEVVCIATFLIGQAIYAGVVTPTASLSNGADLRAVLLAGVYLALLAVLGFSLGLILRQSAACISVFVSLLLIVPIIMFLLPQSWQNSYEKFEPSNLGSSMMSVTPRPDLFGTWSAFAVLLIYVVVVFGVGVGLFQRRDA